MPAGNYLTFASFMLYGIACIETYLACREDYCLVTCPGFCLAAPVMLLRVTGIFDHGVGVHGFGVP